MEWEVLSTEYLTKHPPYFVSRKDVCRKKDKTIIPVYYVVELPPAVLVFAIMDDGKILMIKQYRHPVNEVSIELPGGFIDEAETPLAAAKREILEETGYTFSSYEYLGKIAANPGVLNNFTHFFLAKDIAGSEEQQLEPSEDVEMIFYTVDELVKILKGNKIIQSVHANACFHALLHLNKLTFVS